MNKIKLKKIISFLLVGAGAVLLILQIGSSEKNYYMQSIGIVSLMTGLFLVNTNLSSRSTENNVGHQEDFEEEE